MSTTDILKKEWNPGSKCLNVPRTHQQMSALIMGGALLDDCFGEEPKMMIRYSDICSIDHCAYRLEIKQQRDDRPQYSRHRFVCNAPYSGNVLCLTSYRSGVRGR
jgi:hypothetical protein